MGNLQRKKYKAKRKLNKNKCKKERTKKKKRSLKTVGRKWEELGMDCLVNVFSRVGLQSLLLTVPLVCKSWYEASREPGCWKIFDLTWLAMDSWNDTLAMKFKSAYGFDKVSIWRLLYLAFKHSKGSFSHLILSQYKIPDDPMSEEFELFRGNTSHWFPPSIHVGKLIPKLRNLEWLETRVLPRFEEVLEEISHHCKKFKGLTLSGSIHKRQASAIIELLPNLKFLNLRKASIAKEELIMILDGCKELKELDVRGCEGLGVINDEIWTRTSELLDFKYFKTFPEEISLSGMRLAFGDGPCVAFSWNPWIVEYQPMYSMCNGMPSSWSAWVGEYQPMYSGYDGFTVFGDGHDRARSRRRARAGENYPIRSLHSVLPAFNEDYGVRRRARAGENYPIRSLHRVLPAFNEGYGVRAPPSLRGKWVRENCPKYSRHNGLPRTYFRNEWKMMSG